MDVTALSSVSPTYKEGAENPRLLLVVLQGGRGGSQFLLRIGQVSRGAGISFGL